jgi:hypothetical protein
VKRITLNRKSIEIGIGFLALAGILAYNLTHTGGLLASYVRPAWVGYTAATGIELAIVGLSLRIGELRKSKANPRFFVLTLIAVVIVSALANISEGYAVKFGEPLTLANIGRLDIIQAVVSLAATGLLSLVTFALAEIVGSDVTQATGLSNGQSEVTPLPVNVSEVSAVIPPEDSTVSNVAETDVEPGTTPTLQHGFDLAYDVKADQEAQAKGAALDKLVGHLSSNPDATVTELAKLISRSRQTVYNYLDELEASGRWHRNGKKTPAAESQSD